MFINQLEVLYRVALEPLHRSYLKKICSDTQRDWGEGIHTSFTLTVRESVQEGQLLKSCHNNSRQAKAKTYSAILRHIDMLKKYVDRYNSNISLINLGSSVPKICLTLP